MKKKFNETYGYAGKVFYEVKINDKLQGYEEVVHILRSDNRDPLEKLEEIAKANESSYLDTNGNEVELKLYKVKSLYVIHEQDGNIGEDSFEVYSNIIPATKKEIDEYMRVAYDLHEEGNREVNVSEGARIDKNRRL